MKKELGKTLNVIHIDFNKRNKEDQILRTESSLNNFYDKLKIITKPRGWKFQDREELRKKLSEYPAPPLPDEFVNCEACREAWESLRTPAPAHCRKHGLKSSSEWEEKVYGTRINLSAAIEKYKLPKKLILQKLPYCEVPNPLSSSFVLPQEGKGYPPMKLFLVSHLEEFCKEIRNSES